MQTCRLPGGVLEKNPLASSASALYTRVGFTEQGILGMDVFGTGGAWVRYARKKKSSWCTFCPCRGFPPAVNFCFRNFFSNQEAGGVGAQLSL